MKKNKKIVGIIIFTSLLIVGFILFFIIKKQNNIYTIEEKKWIEDNKNKVIDISIMSDIPILNYNGDGLLFSFLDSLEKELGLKFNKLAYKIDNSVSNEYVFSLVDNASENDILIMKDNYVIVSKEEYTYNNPSEIHNTKIGVLASDIEKFNKLFDNSVEFITFETIDELYNNLISEDTINSIITLKTLVMEPMIKNELKINYQFNNQTKDYVISLNGSNELNNIIKKYYNSWSTESFNEKYNEYLLMHYYDFKQIKDSDRTNVKSKKYVYGFVENGIFDSIRGSNFQGINNLILKSFSNFSGVSITYKKYNSNKELIDAFNNNKIDIFLNNTDTKQFNNKSKTSASSINSKLFVISKNSNNKVIDSLSELSSQTIAIVENSKIDLFVKEYNFITHKYKNIKELLDNKSANDFIIIDMENYNYYKNSDLIDYKIDYIIDNFINYNYEINNDEIVFYDLFNFYTNYTSTNQIIKDGYSEIAYKTINYLYILLVVISFVILSLILISINKIKRYLIIRKTKKRINLSKTDKLKYIDQLTSLKNRAYLNSKIDSWDNSEIYPQSIIVVDLNNISAINDNYGREEGDRVIVEAASILINSQLPNSEIIRTDGNEFLIYLVGYHEKDIISYLRSLSREMKKLSHGFGAATGYSMINDGLKTVDDAVNEATLDMKNNKEDIDY